MLNNRHFARAHRLSLNSAAIGALLFGIMPAHGQTASQPSDAPADDAADDASGGTEIVVTAQRRVERLQDIPVSVQVVGQLEMRTQNLTSIVSLARQNPSIKVQGSGRSSNFFIRIFTFFLFGFRETLVSDSW